MRLPIMYGAVHGITAREDEPTEQGEYVLRNGILVPANLEPKKRPIGFVPS